MDQLQMALRQINQADLSAAEYRAARRLLDVAATTGHVKLTKTHCNELCCTTSEGATRRLLGSLQRAGLIHYSTNGFVYIDFVAWSPAATVGQEWVDEPNEALTVDRKSDRPRAKSDHPRALLDHKEDDETNEALTVDKKSDHPRALLDHPRAKSDHPRAVLDHDETATYTHARARGVCLFVDPILSNQGDLITNKQTPDPEEQALAFALLSYIRVKAPVAKDLATTHSLQTIREAISRWWLNRKSMGGQFEETPGIVVYWLNNWANAGVPELSPHFKHTELYRNFRTAAEQAADRQAEAELAVAIKQRPVVTAPAVVQPADPHAAIWDQVLAEIKLTLAEATYQAFIRDTKVIASDNNHWQIQVANKGALDWIQNRLANKVRRTLSIITNQSVTVEFCLEATS